MGQKLIHTLAPIALAGVLSATASCGGRAVESHPSSARSAGATAMVDPKQEGEAARAAAPASDPAHREIATFGAGCFWCVEAVLEQVEGVIDVVSGYMGGDLPEPTYEEVCSGTTGHAEVVQVTFDPSVIAYEQLLEWFWRLHDPTTLNRQGNDVGTQYRSVIFYRSDEQHDAAVKSKERAQSAGAFQAPIVTELTEAGPFYPAGEDHQDYYRRNPRQGYCRFVIAPKLEKLGLEK